MQRFQTRSAAGFSLVELLIALSLGVLVLAGAVTLFKQGLEATFVVSQRAEMQQNARAAVGMLSRDISLAGAGLPTGGVQLPSGNGSTLSVFGCDGFQCYVPNNTYPNNHLYPIIPGPGDGPATVGSNGATDNITLAYLDTTFPLNQFQISLDSGTQITATVPVPAPVPALPPVLDPGVGLKAGDLIMVTNNLGSAVMEITGVTAAGVITFAADPAPRLNVNQPAVPSGNLTALLGGAQNTASRINVITYFLQTDPGPDGAVNTADDTPRLMRQVNSQSPVPVAENIVNLQVSYDTFDDAAGLNSNLKSVIAAGLSLNQIRKVNVSVTARGAWGNGKHYQSLDLATSVSARNMAFRDRYQ